MTEHHFLSIDYENDQIIALKFETASSVLFNETMNVWNKDWARKNDNNNTYGDYTSGYSDTGNGSKSENHFKLGDEYLVVRNDSNISDTDPSFVEELYELTTTNQIKLYKQRHLKFNEILSNAILVIDQGYNPTPRVLSVMRVVRDDSDHYGVSIVDVQYKLGQATVALRETTSESRTVNGQEVNISVTTGGI